jgi:hypothetical protein
MPRYDATAFDPPAPIAMVSVRRSDGGDLVDKILRLIDTGANIPLLPRSAISRLGITPQAGTQYELIGFDGTRSLADAVELDIVSIRCRWTWHAAMILAVGLLTSAICLAADTTVPRQLPAPGNPMRPATITWGGYNGNEQMIGADTQWPFVQKYMDGYVMHGAYWLRHRDKNGSVSDADVTAAAQALGAALQRNSKTANVESGWLENPRYDQAVPESRASFTNAEHDIAAFREWAKLGVRVSKVRVDWFPIQAAAVYAEKYQTTSVQKLLTMVTGADKYWGTVPGFDPAMASWAEYAARVSKAFPGVELGFDQAPCNFYVIPPDPKVRSSVPWGGLGYGYLSSGLKLIQPNRQVIVANKPVPISLDFADLMMSVARSSRQRGWNYYGFECDTPYTYITDNQGRMGSDLLPFLLRIEKMQQRDGFHYAKILNDALPTSDAAAIEIDFGIPVKLSRVLVKWDHDFARRYSLEGASDGEVFNPLASKSDGRGGVDELSFAASTVKRLRLKLLARGTARGYRIREIEAYGPERPSIDLALGAHASADSARSPSGNTFSWGRKNEMPAPELVDGNLDTVWESNWIDDATWDKHFHDRTLEFLEAYQAAHGRADQYIAESWYPGPYVMFPETQDGTFSNLARDLIRRIRGIDDDGKPFHADLAVRLPGASTWTDDHLYHQPRDAPSMIVNCKQMVSIELQIRNDGVEKNKGDCRATPLLRGSGSFAHGWTIEISGDGHDVTDDVMCQKQFDGLFIGGLEPGESRFLHITASAAQGASAHCPVSLTLYWNPQDPQAIVRDAVSFSFTH